MSLLRSLFGYVGRTHAGTAGAPEFDARPSGASAIAADDGRAAGLAEIDALLGRHRYAEALGQVDAQCLHAPAATVWMLARADVLCAWGRLREARAALEQVLGDPVRRVECLRPLGLALARAGAHEDAEACLREVVRGDRRDPAAGLALAGVLQMQGRLPEAEAQYRALLQQQPDDFEALMGAGSCRLAARDFAVAESLLRRAVVADGASAIARTMLGVVLDRQGRGAEALVHHRRAVELAGPAADANVDLAASLHDAGQAEAAFAVIEPFLRAQPSPRGLELYARMLLGAGRLPEGWSCNEFRLVTEHFASRRVAVDCPAWNGQSLAGRSILLQAEQGIGDIVQFARFAARVKALGAHVHLAVPAPLARLAGGFAGVDRVVDLARLAAEPVCDFRIPLLSLPQRFGVDVASIPAGVPYIDVAPSVVQQWRARLDPDATALNVGLVWAGNPAHLGDRERSLSLAQLAELGEVGGVRWYALQKGSREEESRAAPGGWRLREVGGALVDFADTAAVLSALDLVICVDTAVAHLAGALGKPVWVLVPTPADWRWLTGREDSPWYPTMRLFRQRVRGEWGEVVGRVRAALAEVVGGVRALPAVPRRAAAGEVVPAVPVVAAARRGLAGWSAVAETRYGIMQYLPAEAGVGEGLGWYGEWLPGQVAVLTQVVRAGMTVLEVGAGVGAHALVLARLVGPAGHLLLDEPRPVHRRILRHNLDANALRGVTLLRRPAAAGAPDAEPVDGLALARLDCLKIGADMPVDTVLQGAAATLWRCRPSVFCAVAGGGAGEVADCLREFGYRCWLVETPWFDPGNFNRRDADVTGGRTAQAVLAGPEERDAPATGLAELR